MAGEMAARKINDLINKKDIEMCTTLTFEILK
jgi:hypothetical protein